MQAGGSCGDDVGGEGGEEIGGDLGPALIRRLDLQRDQQVIRGILPGQLGDAAQAGAARRRHDARQDVDGHATGTGTLDEVQVVIGPVEQLRDGEVRAGDLLGEQRVYLLLRTPRVGVSAREGGDGHALGSWPSAQPAGAGLAGHRLLRERLALLLHAVDELDELGGAAEVADVGAAVGRRVPPEGEEARDAGVEEPSHQLVGLLGG